jgi:hypothetical protein
MAVQKLSPAESSFQFFQFDTHPFSFYIWLRFSVLLNSLLALQAAVVAARHGDFFILWKGCSRKYA